MAKSPKKKSKHGPKWRPAKKGELSSIGNSAPGSPAVPSIPTASELLRPTGTDTVEEVTWTGGLRSLSLNGSSQTHPTRMGVSREDGELVYIKVGITWKMKQEIETVAGQMGVSQNEVARRMFAGYLDAYALIHRSMR